MSEGAARDETAEVEREVDGMRAVAERLAVRLGGHPGLVRLHAVMDVYDRAGGGLVAGGLAYTSLLALLPALLLALSAVGFVLRDPALQEQIVAAIAQVLPPLEDLAKLALAGVGSGAVPTGVFAIVTLLWGSSRLYANLDTAFSRIFSGAPRRNPVEQTVRGVVLTVVIVLMPVAVALIGSVLSWVATLAPAGVDVGAALSPAPELVWPVGSLLASILAVALCYRLVPSEHVPWRALLLPAGAVGLVLAGLTQVYVFIAPRLMGLWAIYGTALAFFALLAWLSIAFNILLLGAAWTKVRSQFGPLVGVRLPGRHGRAGDVPGR